MKNPSKTLATIAAPGLILTLPAAFLWYYDVYVNWQPKLFPFAVVVLMLGCVLLTLLTLWVRGEKPKALAWKTALSFAVFCVSLIGVSTAINNWIGPVFYGRHMAGLAAGVSLPLAAAQLVVLFVLLAAAFWKRNRKGAWALLSVFAAMLLGFAVYTGVEYIRGFTPKQPEITPVFPEPRAAGEPIPYETKDGEGMNVVWLESGTYPSLELSSLSNVIYSARPGEEVIVTGSKEITGWQADKANGVPCWSTKVEGDYFTSLYHSDPEKQLRRPRYPAEVYLFADHADGARAVFTKETAPWELTRGHTSFFAKEGDLRQFRAMGDVTLRILHKWKDEISNVVSYDDNTRELVWERPASMTVERNDRYFLENVFEELKEPGQWYLDKESAKLYYIPFEDDKMESTVLYAGMEERLLTVDGGENVTFRDVTFQNSAWNFPASHWLGVEDMDSSQAAYDVHPCVLVTGSAGVRFENCKFENIGATALKFGENTHDSGVTDCEFSQIGGNAVFIHGLYDAPNSNITVKNNLIAHYGRRFFNAIGVLNINAHHVEISHNEISDGYYSAISNGWVWGYAPNPTDYVTIENNLIYDIGQGWLSDMGGIYCLGIQEHSVIRGNVIHDVAANPLQGGYGGWGIYLDEGSSGQLVEKNLVYCCGSQSFDMHYGKENLVRNNIFALSRQGQISVGKEEEHTTFILERNIIVSDGQALYNYLEGSSFRDDGNLYYDYASPRRPFSTRRFQASPADRLGLPAVRRMGYYRNALFADPLFKDPKNFDFTLALNSPAVTQMGFEIWDYTQAGRLKEQEGKKPA
ncbi:MAG: right-handed parallel beta-helix repeat-containing protein [Firmicutes bacterium]|nr:right-handed parallel beta-helix repeat-containing protein [Bacillota bacterium]